MAITLSPRPTLGTPMIPRPHIQKVVDETPPRKEEKPRPKVLVIWRRRPEDPSATHNHPEKRSLGATRKHRW